MRVCFAIMVLRYKAVLLRRLRSAVCWHKINMLSSVLFSVLSELFCCESKHQLVDDSYQLVFFKNVLSNRLSNYLSNSLSNNLSKHSAIVWVWLSTIVLGIFLLQEVNESKHLNSLHFFIFYLYLFFGSLLKVFFRKAV